MPPRQTPFIRGGTARYRELESVLVSGAADDLIIEVGPVPVDEVWYIHTADVRTTDSSARNVFLEVTRDQGIVGPVIRYTSITSAQAVESLRAFYLGPGWFLQARADALTLGTALRLRFARIRLLLGEVVPIG